jgi:hypothetical protein
VKVASDTGDKGCQGQAFGEQDGGDFLWGEHVYGSTGWWIKTRQGEAANC